MVFSLHSLQNILSGAHACYEFFCFSLYIADRQQDYNLLTITHTTAFSHQSTHVSPRTADKYKRDIIVALYDMHGEACVFLYHDINKRVCSIEKMHSSRLFLLLHHNFSTESLGHILPYQSSYLLFQVLIQSL